MALTRYRHFWSSRLMEAAVQTANSDMTQTVDDLTDGSDLVSIIKSYNPPEFAREVRQVETGKVMNERILGRLDPEATNFSISMPSDFEIFYGYNHDYKFEIIEELHNNNNANRRYAIDVVVGTLFRREWGDYMQNGQDRDVTLHFILKEYTRSFARTAQGADSVQVLDIVTGLGTTGTGTYRFRGRTGDSLMDTANANVPRTGESGDEANETGATFFGPNRGIPTS